MNTQQIRDEIAVIVHQWNWSGRHPIPDTLDAAVGVIEGAGYRVYELTWSYADESYTAIAKCDKTHKEIAASAYDDDGRWKAAVRSVGDAMWQLALACVKAQRKEEA